MPKTQQLVYTQHKSKLFRLKEKSGVQLRGSGNPRFALGATMHIPPGRKNNHPGILNQSKKLSCVGQHKYMQNNEYRKSVGNRKQSMH